MKRFLWILTVLLFIPSILSGQEFSIKSFYLAETDLTAMTPGTQVKDQNGNPCALIKVESTDDDFIFSVGMLGVTERKREGGEIWIYVPFGVRKLTVSHPKLGILRDYPFPCPIEQGRTYILKFNGLFSARVYDSSQKQKLVLQVHPDTAKVQINGITMNTPNGLLEQEFSFGVYDVTVSASRYHTIEKTIEVKDPVNPHHFNISLKPLFGWLQIHADGDETIKIEGEEHPEAHNGKVELMSGHYHIEIAKPFYKPFNTVIEIKDSTVLELTPTFEINYKELDLRVANSANIFIDDVWVGNGSWKGKVEYGEHLIECRQSNHRTSSMTINVEPSTLSPIMLDAPEPIYSTLNAHATPAGAEVYIDGEMVGHTPCTVKILIGYRNIDIIKKGYVPYSERISIEEGKATDLNIKLSDIFPVSIHSKPKATIQIDGESKGTTPCSVSIPVGEHKLVLKAKGYYDLKRTFKVYEPNKVYSYRMKQRFYYPTSFYFNAGYHALGYSGLTGNLGACLKNFNFEIGVKYGLSKSETIYWNNLEDFTIPDGYQYTPIHSTLKFGYALTLGNRLRLIPQVGAGILALNGKRVEGNANAVNVDKGYCIPLSAGMRLDIALAPHIAITLNPDYLIPVHTNELYSMVSDVSSKIMSYGSGLGASAGFSFIF